MEKTIFKVTTSDTSRKYYFIMNIVFVEKYLIFIAGKLR